MVVRRLSACLAPSTLVEGREDTKRSFRKDCADDEVASRRLFMDATMEAAAEVFCEVLRLSWPAPGLDGLAMVEMQSAFGCRDVAFFRSSKAIKGPAEFLDQTSIVKTSKAPNRACR